jgi:activating signal cointegrator complex subunit 1
MGKKKQNGEYNDFLDGEKLRDNREIRTSLHGDSSTTQDTSPPPVHQERRENKHGKGKGGPKKPPLTHFLCLPLVNDESRPHLQTGLAKLKEDLERDSLVPTKAIRPLGTLHLTLGVMSLDAPKLEEAKRYLQELDLHHLLRDLTMQKAAEQAAEAGTISENLIAAGMPDTDALTISLESLTPMQSPQNTSILYAAPKDPTNRLLPFASLLRTHFTQQGLMVEDARPLKLHATIVNTIYAKPSGARKSRSSKVKSTLETIGQKISPHRQHGDGSDGDSDGEDARSNAHGPDAKSWMRFDARALIEAYKGFTWAENVRIESVQICRMGARKVWSGGVEGEGEVVDEKYEVVFEKGIFE